MKILALALIFCLVSRVALAAPCAETDTECLLRTILQQTNELEAERLRLGHCQHSNDLLNEALKQEQERSDHGGRVFFFGLIVGATFVGLAATMAMKAIRS